MKCCIVLTAAVLLGAGPAAATIITVSPDGPLTIQAAIDQAENGDVVELLNGTYSGPGNRDLDLLGKAITVRSQSGDATACVLDCQGNDLDNHRGFLIQSEEGLDTVIEGLTITHGYHSWSGGIFCDEGGPTIRGCRFLDNVGSEGGGISMQGHGHIVDCHFEGNQAENGGGVSVCCALGVTATLERCTFVNNTATSEGGGFRT